MSAHSENAYRAAAKGLHADDELEIDDDAIVSPGSDSGAFVAAWIWITDEEAKLFEEESKADEPEEEEDGDEDNCRVCGEHYAPGGDGFDGCCGDCADRLNVCSECGEEHGEFPEEETLCDKCKLREQRSQLEGKRFSTLKQDEEEDEEFGHVTHPIGSEFTVVDFNYRDEKDQLDYYNVCWHRAVNDAGEDVDPAGMWTVWSEKEIKYEAEEVVNVEK